MTNERRPLRFWMGAVAGVLFSLSMFDPVARNAYAQLISAVVSLAPGNDKTMRVLQVRDGTGNGGFLAVMLYGRDASGLADPILNDSTKGMLVQQGSAGSAAWPVSVASITFPTAIPTATAVFTVTPTPTQIPYIVVAGTVSSAGENAVTTPTSGKQIQVDFASFSVATASSNGARLHFMATVTAGNMIAGHTDLPAGAEEQYNPPPVIQEGLMKSGGRIGATNHPVYLNLTDAEAVDYVLHYREITP